MKLRNPFKRTVSPSASHSNCRHEYSDMQPNLCKDTSHYNDEEHKFETKNDDGQKIWVYVERFGLLRKCIHCDHWQINHSGMNEWFDLKPFADTSIPHMAPKDLWNGNLLKMLLNVLHGTDSSHIKRNNSLSLSI